MQFFLKKIKLILIPGFVLLVALLLYAACVLPLHHEKTAPATEGHAKLFSASHEQNDALLNGVPVSVPAAASMQLRNPSFKNSFHSKLFVFSPCYILVLVKPFLSFYKNERVNASLHPVRLHLAFCVFRI